MTVLIPKIKSDGQRDRGWFNRVTDLLNKVTGYREDKPQECGVWIDGKIIKRKVVDFGALPNAATKDVAHGIPSFSLITSLYGVATNGTLTVALPHVNVAAVANGVALAGYSINVRVITGINFSAYTAFIIVEYV